jgi:hypothetical protein
MATILIWNNNNHSLGGGHDVTGHSAMNITDNWVEGASDNGRNYVSWWPGEQKKELLGHSKGRKFGVEASNFLEDIKDEGGYAPDHIIRVDNKSIDTNAMLAKWSEIRNKENAHYRYLRKNCSTIVARVMRTGTKSGSGWYRHSTIWTPLKVKRFALDIGGKELDWLSFTEEISTFVSGPEAACLRMLKRRSSSHGFSGGAKPRFSGGKDSGKFNPFDCTYDHDKSGNLLKVNQPLLPM